MEPESRKPYPSDVSDDEWAFVAPYLVLMRPDAPQRRDEPREVYNALRWIVRTGAQWRYLPTNFPPWEIVYQQAQRWMAADGFTTSPPWRTTFASCCAGSPAERISRRP